MHRYSVIIPVYQVGDYIEECLDSVFSQLPQGVQVILMDDGSTDGSGEICEVYSKKHSCTQVFHQANKGVAAARNIGLHAANGEYLIWVDPDDCVTSDWFHSIDTVIQQENPDILLFDYYEWRNETRIKRSYNRPAGKIDKEIFLNDVVKDIRINSSLWNKVFRRALFDSLQFDESLLCLEDYSLLHKLIMLADNIYYQPLCLYVYRIRNSGLVRTLNLEISYQSYLTALKRKQEIEASGRTCNIMGCLLQAKGFCWNYFLAGCPAQKKAYFSVCRRIILKHTLEILCEKDLSRRHRIELLTTISPRVQRIKLYFQTCKGA